MKQILLIGALLAFTASANAQKLMQQKMSTSPNSERMSNIAGFDRKDRFLSEPYIPVAASKQTSYRLKLDSIVYSTYDDSVYTINERQAFEYDANGNCIVLDVNGEYREEYSFVDGKISEINVTESNFEGINRYKYVYAYTSGGLVDSVTFFGFDNSLNLYVEGFHSLYEYNNLNQLVSLSTTVFNGSTEYVSSKYTYEYNADGLLTRKSRFAWSHSQSEITYGEMIQYVYENNLLTAEIYYDVLDDGTLGKPYNGYIFTHNTDSTFNDMIYVDYDDSLTLMESKRDFNYSTALTASEVLIPQVFLNNQWEGKFFKHGVPLLSHNYSNRNGYNVDPEWYLSEEIAYYYSGFTSDVSNLGSATALTVYPNPVTDKLYLSSGVSGNVTCHLINLMGRTVLTAQLLPGGAIDMGTVKSGCYLLQVDDSKSVRRTIKVVKK